MRLALLTLALALPGTARSQDFQLHSPDVREGQRIASAYVYNADGCAGKNISPALRWNDPPAGTKSFALTVFDPDAPTGHGWLHWAVIDLPASTRALPRNAGNTEGALLPPGSVQLITDFGSAGYGGPCPPKGHGIHHYVFTLSALPMPTLELPGEAGATEMMSLIEDRRLATATLTAVYQR